MIVNLVSVVQFGVAFVVLTLTQATHAEDFLWQYGGTRIGRLAVPAGFKVENYDYREGIVTTLVYQDGSRITLQSSGMYGLRLFKGAEYTLIFTEELPAKTVRVGRAANGTTCWREDNYRPKTANGKRIFPPNLGYSRVPPVRRSDFDRALESFIREIDGRPAPGR